jgi:hypothetical protein
MKHIGIGEALGKLIFFAAVACMVLVLLPAGTVKAQETRNLIVKKHSSYDLTINSPDSSDFYFGKFALPVDKVSDTKSEYGFEYVPAEHRLILDGLKNINSIRTTATDVDLTITVVGDNTISCGEVSPYAIWSEHSNIIFDLQPNARFTINASFDYDYPAIYAKGITVRNGSIANGEKIIPYIDKFMDAVDPAAVTIGTEGYPSPQVVLSNGDPYDMTTQQVFRLYNYENGEHLYTTDVNERNVLFGKTKWNYEDVAWYSPKAENYSGALPVYRLFNKYLDNHLYTTDQNEINVLLATGSWQMDNDSKPLFYSGGDTPIYRLYNEGLKGMHLLTTDKNEYDVLPGMTDHAWTQEGAKLNCVKAGK